MEILRDTRSRSDKDFLRLSVEGPWDKIRDASESVQEGTHA